MIRDLLEATRAESGKIHIEPRCITIVDLIQQAVSMMSATAKEKRVGLEVGLDARIPFVYADADRVLQVLINLIDNAIKFTPADGLGSGESLPGGGRFQYGLRLRHRYRLRYQPGSSEPDL